MFDKGYEVVAKVGSHKITAKEVQEKLKELPASYRDYLKTPGGQKQFIDLLIREKMMLAEANKKGVPGRKEIKDSINEFKNSYKKRLQEYEQNLVLTTILKELQEKEFVANQSDLMEYYNAHRAQFTHPQQTKVSHILVSSEEEAKQVIKKIRGGEKFEEAAKKYSIDPASNMYGGELGEFKQGELLPEFEDPVLKLGLGQVSEPIKTSYGYHILKKTGVKNLSPQTFDQAKETIQKVLMKKKFDMWMEKKKQEFSVKIYDDKFTKVLSAIDFSKDFPRQGGEGYAGNQE